MRICLKALIAILVSAISIGCTTVPNFAKIQSSLNEHGHYIEGVPFYLQGESSCGPAALASVTSYWGRHVDLEQIKARVYLAELRGTLPIDMESYLRDVGFETKSNPGTVDGLKSQIRRNIPVICLVDLGFSVYRRPHYVTVIGFDDANQVVIAHDGLTANKVISWERFIKEWGRAGNWMLIATLGDHFKKD